MNNPKLNNVDPKIKKDSKSSKDSLIKEILHDEFGSPVNENEIQVGRDHTNQEDHHKKRISGVKKGFCDQNKCDVYFE